jgi:Polyketide cyclase / dehydrase and lipid transport
MKSLVEIEINVPQRKLAELYADPGLTTRWMDDIQKVEPISGELGMVGSKYRLVPKKGDMVFVATVIARNVPNEFQLSLDASNVTVSVKGTLRPLSPQRTQLTSEEEFQFKGLFNTIFGFFAGGAIKRAHRRHMESFKQFAEAEHSH